MAARKLLLSAERCAASESLGRADIVRRVKSLLLLELLGDFLSSALRFISAVTDGGSTISLFLALAHKSQM